MLIKNRDEIKKILLIKLRGIGDVVLSTIVLENLRNYFPNAKIDFLTEMPSHPVLFNLSHLSEIIIIEKSKPFKLFKKIISNKYDIVFDFYSNPRTAFITYLSRANFRLGYKARGRNYAYNYLLDTQKFNIHNAEINLELIKLINIPINTKIPQYKIEHTESELADIYITKNISSKKLIAVLPSGGWQSKRCEPEIFSAICRLINQKLSFNFLILYGKGDYEDAIKIFNQTKDISFLGPPTNIREMAALISKCKATISNDSGPMHLSAALPIPTLAIFGPTNPLLQGPYNYKHKFVRNESLPCIQCDLLDCPKKHECMLELDINKVYDKFVELLEENGIN